MKKGLVSLFSVLLLVAPSMVNSYQAVADVIETEKNQNQEITTNNKATTEDTGKETIESSFSEKDHDGVESTSVNETNVSETDTAEEDSSKESRNGDETSEQTKTTESQTVSSSPQANNSNPSSANEVDQVIQDAAIQDIASGTAGTAPWRIDSNGVLHIGAGQLEDNVMNLWGGYLETIKEIVFEGNVIAGLSLRSFFDGMINLTAIQNLDRLDTSNVRDMYRMFINTHSLSSVDVSNFDTRQVKDMREMFYGTGIEALDLSSFDTSQVTNMNGMFFLSNLKQVNLANFDTSQVTDMGSMFSRANFTSIDVSSFDTSQVTNMSAMFDRAGEVSSLNLSNFDTSKVRDMRYMFNGLAELASLDVSSFDTTQVQNMASIFTGTQSLTNINLSSFDTSLVKNMDNMFEGIGVSSLDVSTFDTSQVTSMTAMFRNAASITDLDLSNFNTSNVIGFSLMFAGMTNLVSLDLSSFDTNKEFGYLSAMFDGATMLKQLKLGTNIKKLYPVAALPAIPVSNMYTGYWQNVGSGTVDNPKGTTILTSAELLRTYAGGTMADTYVWQKQASASIQVHDSTIYTGDNWQAEDNFGSALDKDGNPVAFQDITVEGSVDTNTPGTYQVNYRYDGVTSTATITVKANQTAVNAHDSTIYVGDNWEAEDNFDSALDKDGNDVALSALMVDASKADTNKAGSFKVTYTYDGVTSAAIVTVKEKMTAVNVHDSTLYVGDNWQAEDNFDSALDKDGSDVDFSALTVDASKADTSKSGSFEVTYTYDGVTSTAIVTVKEKMTAVNVHDSTLYVGDNWEAEDNFDSALDKDGNPVDFQDLAVDASKADTSKSDSFEVTYTYDGITSTAIVTVKEKMTAVNVHDYTLYVGDTWQAEDNFDSALDKDGNSVDFQDLVVNDSEADTSKAGSFEVTYTYEGVTSTAIVTVKDKMTAVNVHDSTIYVGDNWEAEDNFDSALDKDGNDVALSDLTVDVSKADTSKAGSFDVTYTYDGVTSTATITVKEKMTAVNVHDSTIYVGDKWEAEDNFDNALDKDGNSVDFQDLTIDASQADTSKSGSFEVTYTYDGVTSTAVVTVKEKQTAVNVHDSTIYVGDSWEAEDNFNSALDKDGNDVALSDLTVDASQSDTSKAGSFKVTYTYDGITSTATITVKEKMTAVNVHDSTINVGDNWEVEDNFDGALDKDGNDVDFSALTVDARKADTSKAGSFKVTYTYDGITSTAIITVKEKMTAVNVHDSTIYVGDKWTAKENFDNALDKAGKKVVYEDLTVDASQVDTSKAGRYEVSYSYDGITVTATVTVKEKPSQDKPEDDSTHTTPEQKKENRKKTTSDSKKQVTLPKTNENKSVVELVAGVIIVLLTGVIFFWKKRKANKA